MKARDSICTRSLSEELQWICVILMYSTNAKRKNSDGIENDENYRLTGFFVLHYGRFFIIGITKKCADDFSHSLEKRECFARWEVFDRGHTSGSVPVMYAKTICFR